MFTGIVTDVGRVRRLRRTGPEGGLDLSIATAYDTAEIALGASIACSGVCLTVVAVEPGAFSVQASAETLSCSTLGDWIEGTAVNLERALRVGDELGGHIVSGHVDGVARIVDRRPEGESVRFVIAAPAGADAVYRAQGIGRARRGQPDGQRGRVRPLRRQHHPAHAVAYRLRRGAAGTAHEYRNRSARALCRPALGARPGIAEQFSR